MEEDEHGEEQVNKSLVALENHTQYIHSIEQLCNEDKHIDHYDIIIGYLDQMRLDVINDIDNEYISKEVAHVLDDIEKMKIDMERLKESSDDDMNEDNWIMVDDKAEPQEFLSALKRIRKQYGFICSKLRRVYQPIKPLVIALQILGAIYTQGFIALIPIAWQIID